MLMVPFFSILLVYCLAASVFFVINALLFTNKKDISKKKMFVVVP